MVLTLALLTLSLALPVWAGGLSHGINNALSASRPCPQHHPVPKHPLRHEVGPLARLHHWNEIAIDASGLDHTPVAPGEDARLRRAARPRAVEPGDGDRPHRDVRRGERDRRRLPELHRPPAARRRHTSLDAAIAQAAHDTLVALFPSQTASFDGGLAEDLGHDPGRACARRNGIELGQRAAAAILALRANDGSEHAEPRVGIDYIPSDGPGSGARTRSARSRSRWAHWGEVTPFVLESPSSSAFRRRPP